MEESLKLYLESVADDVADRLWNWLDGNPAAPQEMVVALVDSHPVLQQQCSCVPDAAEEEPPTGRLEDWSAVWGSVWGSIHEDSKHRFPDGAQIHTSRVISPSLLDTLKEGDIIVTKNSRYLLGKGA